MKYSELKAIIEFMYHGEVNVAQDQLSALMKTAETLRVKGLAEMPNEKNSSNASQEEPSHRSVPRTETPPPSKRRRGRVRKRSLSDSNRSDDSNETKIKQPVSPDIEELSGDVTMDATSGQFSNLQSQVPMQTMPSHNTNSYQKVAVVSQEPQIEEPPSADESEFGVEPAKLLEQTLTTDDLSNARRSGRTSMSSNMEMQRRPRSSTDHSSNIAPTSMSSDVSLGSNQQPESPPDIKPELLELDHQCHLLLVHLIVLIIL
ncbi:hypothetical protein TNCT_355361 [Trichonephila clavata]|uniref:BTB domain-containing protein n=1 Tax=Trichonephila clavata TaxID=2740835 RepID=A0A8X6KYE8_TRICU|nr:hypothetical protein TNCT_355361 [Trichonephila clavata]